MSKPSFKIENRAGINVLVWRDGSCRPAEETEIELWELLAASAAQAVDEESERAKFDAWFSRTGRTESVRFDAWDAWRDRAALAAPVQPSADPAANLAKVADGTVSHIFNGMCPDAVEGHDSRDPDCPACQALILFTAQQ